jgi:hypothetical protein
MVQTTETDALVHAIAAVANGPLSLDHATSVGTAGSTLTAAGAVTVTQALTASSTVAVTGAMTAASTLAVTGAMTASSTLAVTGTSTLTGALLGDVKAALPSFADYTAVDLTADTTLAPATHSAQVGKYVTVSADAKTLTLPAVVVGTTFIIVNNAADAAQLLTISPNGSDRFLVDIAGAAGTDDKDIINTKATMKQYDYVKLVGISADGWLIDEVRGTWVDES